MSGDGGQLKIEVTADTAKLERSVRESTQRIGRQAEQSLGEQVTAGLSGGAGGATRGGRLAGLAYSAAYSKAANAIMSDSAQRLGNRMSLGLTAPLTLFAGASVKTASEFESSMSQVAYAIDKPIDQLGDMQQLALDLGGSTVFSANEVAQAMTELAKGGFSQAEIKAGALESTLALAAAGGIELADAGSQITAAMNTFGIEAADSAQIADALAGAADASAADVADLAAGLENVGQVASLANQSLPDVTGVLAALADNGTKGAEAGSSLRSAMASLIKPTDAAQKVMKQYGIDVYDAQGNMVPLYKIAGQLEEGFKGVDAETRNAALSTLFGAYGIKAASVLYKQGEDGIRKYTEASKEQGAAAEAAEAKMGPTTRALEELAGAWETLQVQVGSALAPIVQKAAGLLGKLAELFGKMPSWAQTAAVGIGIFVAAIGPAIKVLGGMIGGVRTLLQWAGRLGGAGKAISAAKAAGCADPCAGVPGKGKGGAPVAPVAQGGKLAAAMAGVVSFLSNPITVAAITAASLAVQVMKVANSDRPDLEVSPQQLQPGVPTGGQAGLGPQVSEGNRAADEARRAEENVIRLREAEQKYAAALQATNGVIAQRNNGTLKGQQLTTAAKNALQGYVNETRGLTEEMVRQKAPAQEVANQALASRQAFLQQAVAMGFSKQEAALLASKMDLIPEDVQTYIKTQGAAEAQEKLDALDKRLERLKAKRTAIKVEGKGDKESAAKLADIDKKIDRVRGKKATVRAEQKGLDQVADKLEKFPGLINKLSQDEITIGADAADADAEIKQTKADLEALQDAPWKPKIDVESDAATEATNTATTLDGIDDEYVYINVVRRNVGGGGGGGGGPEAEQGSLFRVWRSGRDVAQPGAGLFSAGGGTVYGARPKPPYGAFGGLGAGWWNMLRAEYAKQYEALGELAAAAFSDAQEDALAAEQRRIDAGERKRQRKREDADLEWQRARQKKSNDLARAAEKLKGEEKKKANRKARRYDLKTENLQIKRSRRNEDEDRRIGKQIDARRQKAERARRDAEIRQQKIQRDAEDTAQRLKEAAEARAAHEQQIAQSVWAQYDARRQQLRATATFTRSPASTLRNINKQAALLRGLGGDLEVLRSKGLSADAIAQLLQMDPKDAAKLAKRLASDPALIGQMNSAYAGLSEAASKVAAEDTRTQWQGVGGGIVDGIIRGLAGGKEGLLGYLKGLSQDMLDVVKKHLGIASPSREFAGIGADAGRGMVAGLQGMERKVAAASQRLAHIPAGATIGGDGAALPGIGITVNPSAGMDERMLAAQIGREVSWRL